MFNSIQKYMNRNTIQIIIFTLTRFFPKVTYKSKYRMAKWKVKSSDTQAQLICILSEILLQYKFSYLPIYPLSPAFSLASSFASSSWLSVQNLYWYFLFSHPLYVAAIISHILLFVARSILDLPAALRHESISVSSSGRTVFSFSFQTTIGCYALNNRVVYSIFFFDIMVIFVL